MKEGCFMNITDTKIRKIFKEGALRAIVSVTLDECLAIHDIKVIQGNSRLFVAMPSRQDENGIYRDIIHPIYPEAREKLENEILTAYENYAALMNVLESED